MWSQTSHNCFPLFYEIENCSNSNIVFKGQCPFPLLQCKTANGHFFFNSLPSPKRPSWGAKSFWNLNLWYIVIAPTGFPLRGRIRLNQLLNNVRVNRNIKFKRLELLPFETVFEIQSKNPTSPTENGHYSTFPPPPPPTHHLHGHDENGFLTH